MTAKSPDCTNESHNITLPSQRYISICLWLQNTGILKPQPTGPYLTAAEEICFLVTLLDHNMGRIKEMLILLVFLNYSK